MQQASSIGAKAQKPNPALAPLGFLIGEWVTSGSHPHLPGKALEGRASFSWHQGGAFILMRAQVDEPGFPDGVAIIGGDNLAGTLTLMYFDERGVSRLYEASLGERSLTWRRDDPHLSQSMTIAAGEDGDTLISTGRMSQNGGAWGDDLSQVFRRAPG